MKVIGFYYEDIMDQAGWWQKLAAQVLARQVAGKVAFLIDKPVDYLQDIFLFFMDATVRKRIEARLMHTLDNAGPGAAVLIHGIGDGRPDFYRRWQAERILSGPSATTRVIGHSLGSLIAYWFLLNRPLYATGTELVTLGSPLGSFVLQQPVQFWLGRICRRPLGRPRVQNWFNIHSALDPLSGEIGAPYGCLAADQHGLAWKQKTFHHEVDEQLQAYKNLFFFEPPAAA